MDFRKSSSLQEPNCAKHRRELVPANSAQFWPIFHAGDTRDSTIYHTMLSAPIHGCYLGQSSFCEVLQKKRQLGVVSSEENRARSKPRYLLLRPQEQGERHMD